MGFATLEEARRAVRMLDGRAVGGYTISVKPASAAPLPQQQCGGCTRVRVRFRVRVRDRARVRVRVRARARVRVRVRARVQGKRISQDKFNSCKIPSPIRPYSIRISSIYGPYLSKLINALVPLVLES